jgi:hypothetical protein
MKRFFLTVVPVAVIVVAGIGETHSADFFGSGPPPAVFVRPNTSSCAGHWVCRADSCYWKRSCVRTCPGRYSCSSLYGAYGPYGGSRYWSAYTFGGWGTY